MEFIRERIEREERERLSPYAAKASQRAGRLSFSEPDSFRTCFQQDRDRILHSKSFRRLKHKTQVFLHPDGDHYRTRLTHTLEVAQIARTIGRALRLNEDLIEAIALGHDVGHTPFGHVGEQALDQAIHAANRLDLPNGFNHSEQSLRVLDEIEKLNLTQETREGIGGHSKGRNDLSNADGQPISTLEASVVRVSDRIAYLSHDLDDAIRAGVVESPPSGFGPLSARHSERVGAMVGDVICHSLDQPHISLSDEMLKQMNAFKEWMFENVYLAFPAVSKETDHARLVVVSLFYYYLDRPEERPLEGARGAVDYVAGMTDRFALHQYDQLFLLKS